VLFGIKLGTHIEATVADVKFFYVLLVPDARADPLHVRFLVPRDPLGHTRAISGPKFKLVSSHLFD